MPSAATVRRQVEAALAERVPSALSVAPRSLRPVVATGIEAVDQALEGGLPVGAITEVVGPECSGRTSLTLAFLARMTQAGKVCAWIDVSNALQPESAAAAGVDLARLLWVRCGARAPAPATAQPKVALPQSYFVAPPIKRGLHGGGCGGHPRDEAKGLAEAVQGLMGGSRPVEAARRVVGLSGPAALLSGGQTPQAGGAGARIDQGIRVADLLLQGGGFSAVVLDLAGVAAELSSRIPIATWFRYRAAAERTQSCFLLLTQHACAKSSAGLVVQLQPGEALGERTVLTGVEHRLEVARQRFGAQSNVVPLRKPPQRSAGISSAQWQSRAAWAGRT